MMCLLTMILLKVTHELLRWRNTCLTKATNIIVVPTRIRFWITRLPLSILG